LDVYFLAIHFQRYSQKFSVSPHTLAISKRKTDAKAIFKFKYLK